MTVLTLEECTNKFSSWLDKTKTELNESEKVQYFLILHSYQSLKGSYLKFLENTKEEISENKKEEKFGFITGILTLVIGWFVFNENSIQFHFILGFFIFLYLFYLLRVKSSEKMNSIVFDQISKEFSSMNISLLDINKFIKIEEEYSKTKSFESDVEKELQHKFWLFNFYFHSQIISLVSGFRLNSYEIPYREYINV